MHSLLQCVYLYMILSVNAFPFRFAVVCTFVTNELYKKRFIDNPEIFNVAKKNTKRFITYVDDSFQVRNVFTIFFKFLKF